MVGFGYGGHRWWDPSGSGCRLFAGTEEGTPLDIPPRPRIDPGGERSETDDAGVGEITIDVHGRTEARRRGGQWLRVPGRPSLGLTGIDVKRYLRGVPSKKKDHNDDNGDDNDDDVDGKKMKKKRKGKRRCEVLIDVPWVWQMRTIRRFDHARGQDSGKREEERCASIAVSEQEMDAWRRWWCQEKDMGAERGVPWGKLVGRGSALEMDGYHHHAERERGGEGNEKLDAVVESVQRKIEKKKVRVESGVIVGDRGGGGTDNNTNRVVGVRHVVGHVVREERHGSIEYGPKRHGVMEADGGWARHARLVGWGSGSGVGVGAG